MPFPRSQLDMVIVSSLDDSVISEEKLSTLRTEWERNGYLSQGGLTLLGQEFLGVGDDVGIRFEPSEDYRLYGNHQGGYRVFCPKCNANCTDAYVLVVGEWRKSQTAPQSMSLLCVECHHSSNLTQLIGRPDMSFSRGAIILSNVDSVDVSTEAQTCLTHTIGPIKFIYRRVG